MINLNQYLKRRDDMAFGTSAIFGLSFWELGKDEYVTDYDVLADDISSRKNVDLKERGIMYHIKYKMIQDQTSSVKKIEPTLIWKKDIKINKLSKLL